MLALTACQNSGEAPADSETKTITVSVMTSDRFLELAKTKFEDLHPTITIEIKESVAAPEMPQMPQQSGGGGQQRAMVMNGKPDPKNIEKYVSQINTELMSGKASDIIAMDNLPAKKYADKNLLENIDNLMSQDTSFKMDQYYTGIFDAMKYNGKLYEVPIKVGLNMMLGNQGIVGAESIDDSKWTWEDFVAMSKNHAGGSGIYPLNRIEPDELMKTLLNSSFSRFVDTGGKKSKFDSPEFIGLLKLAKSMYDEQLIPPQAVDANNTIFQTKGGVRTYMDMMAMPQMFYDGKAEYYNLPSESEVKGTSFTPGLPLAINSKSSNKKEAWEFVKFLLSDEMQSTIELGGIAVNKNGSQAQLDNLRTIGQGGRQVKMMLNGKAFSPKPASDDEIARIEQVLNNIRVYAESDLKISTIVSEESIPYFQGNKSAEETAKVIQNKVSTYLQE
jgi:multiple sugar transport system substrate-binding protein